MSTVRSATPTRPTSDAVGERTRLAWWAFKTARAAAVVLVVSWTVLGLTWAVAGQDAISDNLLGFLGVVALFGGMLASLVAFTLAIIARVKQHQRWTLLRFPLLWFPVLLAIVAISEATWFE